MSSEASEAMAAMIASRAEERQLAYQRRQAAAAGRATERTELTVRRAYGLVARHRRKLAHLRAARTIA
jgi:hypothetical protein